MAPNQCYNEVPVYYLFIFLTSLYLVTIKIWYTICPNCCLIQWLNRCWHIITYEKYSKLLKVIEYLNYWIFCKVLSSVESDQWKWGGTGNTIPVGQRTIHSDALCRRWTPGEHRNNFSGSIKIFSSLFKNVHDGKVSLTFKSCFISCWFVELLLSKSQETKIRNPGSIY